MKMKIALAAAAAAFSAANPAFAWERIGARTVSDHGETDVIAVSGPKRYQRIKICVYRNPVEFHDVDVNFANGGKQDIAVRRRINPGDCTRNIDLIGGDRNITTIVLKYEETSRRRAKARVRVFAE